ncbi:hypothetical protein BCR44DRAFT_45302 [Catenaria anguillulae PL171]|uniref:Uncharacterized protein n=1 Tax=Catenaria anguillulae PL171 TaxID=765915 RepID=A0A1Y2HB02_9FUNG|nr:hypothetical protein BCR44DRAFT_45302 [Catenaria anguillulae PL171]
MIMLRFISAPTLRLPIRRLHHFPTTATRRSASSASGPSGPARRTPKSRPHQQPSALGPVIIYSAARPTLPRIYLAAGVSAAIFFTSAAFAVYDLLKVTVQVPTSQLDPTKSPDSLAGRIPQFIRKGTPLPNEIQSHLNDNPPSPLRAWIGASACLAIGAVSLTFGWRFAQKWVHSVSLVYPPPTPSSPSTKSVATPALAHITYGTLRKSVKQVPITQCYTIRPVADMIRADQSFFYIKKHAPAAAASKIPLVDSQTHAQSLMLTLDSRGEFKKDGATYSLDRLFLQREPIKSSSSSSSSPTVL